MPAAPPVRALALAAALAAPAAAADSGLIRQDPSAHPDGDAMGWPAPGRRAGLPFHPATPEAMAARCGGDRLQHRVGQRWPQPPGFEPAALRVFAAGDPVTPDMDPARLNNERNRDRVRVVAVRCG
jgi:hypothetical protein